MVGVKSMFLPIALASFLAALTNAQDNCSLHNETCTFNRTDLTNTCCDMNQTNPQVCFSPYAGNNWTTYNGSFLTSCTSDSGCPDNQSCKIDVGLVDCDFTHWNSSCDNNTCGSNYTCYGPDTSFSLRQLVGIVVVMVTTWFLWCGHVPNYSRVEIYVHLGQQYIVLHLDVSNLMRACIGLGFSYLVFWLFVYSLIFLFRHYRVFCSWIMNMKLLTNSVA